MTACPKHEEMCQPHPCKVREKAEALAELRALCPPGTTVYTILRSVSRSGMSRVIDPVVMTPIGIQSIRDAARDILGWSLNKDYDGVKVSGGGMDMGFHLVYSLSRALYPKGFKIPKGERGRNGDLLRFDPDGGYALTHRWL